MPRAAKARVTPRNVVTPLAWTSRMTGRICSVPLGDFAA
jgi:hypothetical protein